MSGEDSEARLEAEALRSGGYRVERIIRQMVDGGDFKATLTHKLEGGLLEFVITTNGSGSAITVMEPDEVRDLHRALERYLQKEGAAMSAYFTIHPIKLETGAMRLVCQDCGWSKVYRQEVPLSEINEEAWLHERSEHTEEQR